jgi:hypothetical protein
MKTLKQQFIHWLETKPADEEYDYCSNNGCAFAQFLIDAGYSKSPMVADEWDDNEGNAHPLPAGLDEALNYCDFELPNCGHTFGALRSRLTQDVSA